MEPISTSIAVKSALTALGKTAIVKKFSGALGWLNITDTAKDKERKAQAIDGLTRALDGDPTGFWYLVAKAGIRPMEGVTAAPKSARYPFRHALRTYYISTGIHPTDDIAKVIGGNLIPVSRVSGATTPALGGVEGVGMPRSGEGGPVLAGLGNVNPVVAIAVIAGLALAFTRRK